MHRKYSFPIHASYMFLLKIIYGVLLVTLIYANCKIVGTWHEAHITKVYFSTAGISFAILNSSM